MVPGCSVDADYRRRLTDRHRAVGARTSLEDSVATEDSDELRAAAHEESTRRRTGVQYLHIRVLRARDAHSLAVSAVAATLAGVRRPAVARLLVGEPVNRPEPTAGPARLGRDGRGRALRPRRSGRRPGLLDHSFGSLRTSMIGGRRGARATSASGPGQGDSKSDNGAHDHELTLVIPWLRSKDLGDRRFGGCSARRNLL